MRYAPPDTPATLRRPTWADLDAERGERVTYWTAEIGKRLPYEAPEKVADAARWLSQWIPEAAVLAISHSPYGMLEDVAPTLIRFAAAVKAAEPVLPDLYVTGGLTKRFALRDESRAILGEFDDLDTAWDARSEALRLASAASKKEAA